MNASMRAPILVAALAALVVVLLLGHASLDSAEARNHLETAARQSERLGRLVADLFELSRLESLIKRMADIVGAALVLVVTSPLFAAVANFVPIDQGMGHGQGVERIAQLVREHPLARI